MSWYLDRLYAFGSLANTRNIILVVAAVGPLGITYVFYYMSL